MRKFSKWNYDEIMFLFKTIILLVIVTAMLGGCSSTKKAQRQVNKVLRNPAAFNQLGMYWQGLHPCVNDTVTKTNTVYKPGTTTVKHDTTYVNGQAIIRDSIFVHDTTFTDRNHYITDGRQVQQLTDSLTSYKYRLSTAYQDSIGNDQKHKTELKAANDKTAAEHSRGDGWMWKFYGLLGTVLVYAGFKSGIIGKFFKLIP